MADETQAEPPTPDVPTPDDEQAVTEAAVEATPPVAAESAEPAVAESEQPAAGESEQPAADWSPKPTGKAAPKAKKPAAAKPKPASDAKPKKPAKPAAKAAAAETAKPGKGAKPARPGLRGRVPTRRRGAKSTDGDVALPVVRAQAKYVRTSARKARLVCDHIRGKSVAEAEAILAFAPRAVAADWAKLLKSAVANAENNHELLGENLRVKEAFADEGPTLKRFRPRAMGRATPIRKRTSHLTITLTPKE
jgi:ribosomal protein L22